MYIENESGEIKMQIVIDIPEEMYKRLAKAPRIATFEECVKDRKMFVTAIQNGTPLPKGHGRLIDADKLHQDIFDDNCWQFSGGISPNEGYSWKQIQNAPTIIEREE